MKSLHIIADLYNYLPLAPLTSAETLRAACLCACEALGLRVPREHFYQFESFDQIQASGATGAEALYQSLLDPLKPRDVLMERVWRGNDLPKVLPVTAPLAA